SARRTSTSRTSRSAPSRPPPTAARCSSVCVSSGKTAGRPAPQAPGRRLSSPRVSPPLLEAISISKSFAGVHALRRVSFDLAAGEVHALVGENGAGKSTLVKIITGAETPDAGNIVVRGQAVHRMDPANARTLGIATIY